jgi:predicted ATPase/DNA-binding SARP family transcriptional activator
VKDSLNISLLGAVQVSIGDKPIKAFAYNKLKALLAYLVVENHTPHTRNTLATLLWPEQSEAAARHSLREAISNLRRALGDAHAKPPHLLITRETVQFNPDSRYRLDVAEFATLHHECQRHNHRSPDSCPQCIQRLARAIALYRGHFLAQFFLADSAEFEEWALLKRESLQRQALEALHHLTTYYVQQRHYTQALTYARQQLQLDPWREEAHRQVMRLLALSGQRHEALAQYETCQRVLQKDLDAAPSKETVALYLRIKDGELTELAPTPRPRHNLPAPTTPLMGRAQELQEVVATLQSAPHRLVTIIGPGGVGKTRLALEAATQLIDHFADGVFYVGIASVRDATTLVIALAQVLNVGETLNRTLLQNLKAQLADKHLLLVIDNFEQVSAAAPLIASLLSNAPRLKLLVTSRHVLQLHGEQVYPLAPLPVPDARTLPSPAALLRYPSVALFTQQAQALQPSFALTPQNAPIIAEICARLDGLPLAIELAAMQTKLLTPHAILERLTNTTLPARWSWLTSAMRDLPARHKTLQNALTWSYDLLNDDEQKLVRRISIFHGSFTLDAAERICFMNDLSMEALTGLAKLVDYSLLCAVATHGDERRFAMLNTIAEFAREQLERSGEASTIHRRHALYYLALAENAESRQRAEKARWQEHLTNEYDNFCAALQWTLRDNHIELGLRLVSALGWFWRQRDDVTSGRQWCERLLTAARGQRLKPSVRAKALNVAGLLAFTQADNAQAQTYFAESMSLMRESKDAERREWMLQLIDALEAMVAIHLTRKRWTHAARLWGALEAARESLSASRSPTEEQTHQTQLKQLRAALSARVLKTAWNKGRALNVEQILHELLTD